MAVSKDMVRLVNETEKVAICDFLDSIFYIIKVNGKFLVFTSKEIVRVKPFIEKYFNTFGYKLRITQAEYDEYISNILSSANPLRVEFRNLKAFSESEFSNAL